MWWTKFLKRIAGWKGKLLSYGGRLVLLKTCLASIPIYLMSIIKFPRWAIELINTHMARFFWDNSEERAKYHLANWHMVSQKKEFGGLGVSNLTDLNLSLLVTWIQRYHLQKDVLWKKIVQFTYRTEHPNLFCCPIQGASPCVLLAAQAAHFGYQWKAGGW